MTREVQSMSSPELVRTIRRLTKEHTIGLLLHNGEEPLTGPLLRATLDEAERRKITIQHPEL